MKRIVSSGLILAALLFVVIPARAWSVEGHNAITLHAITLLKEPLKAVFQQHRFFLTAHDTDPDRWRMTLPFEGPHHFIDLDTFGKPPFEDLPRDYVEAVARHGKEKIDRNGTVPWTIERRYGHLVRAFKGLERFSGDQVLFEAAILAHYVQDAHVPFHAVLNYDGQLTNQRGIHERFEGEIVRRTIDLKMLRSLPLESKYEKIHLAAFGWALESFDLVDEILKADREAKAEAGDYNDKYYAEFKKVAHPIARQRIEQAAQRLATLWQQAYEEAGKVDLARIKTVRPPRGSLRESR